MAQYSVTKILDGRKNAVFHVSFWGDGTGDLADVAVIDPAMSFVEPLPAEPALRIMGLWYDLSGFDAALEFDYLSSDTPVWTMSQGQANQLDFSCFGGLTDRSNPLDGSGKLLLNTNGLGAGDAGSLVIFAKKS